MFSPICHSCFARNHVGIFLVRQHASLGVPQSAERGIARLAGDQHEAALLPWSIRIRGTETSTPALLALLRDNVGLEGFEIRNSGLLRHEDSTATLPFVLPMLQKLLIYGIPLSSVADLLRRIQAPSCVHVKVRPSSSSDAQSTAEYSDALVRFMNSTTGGHSAQGCELFVVTLDEQNAEIEMSSPKPRRCLLRISVSCIPAKDLLPHWPIPLISELEGDNSREIDTRFILGSSLGFVNEDLSLILSNLPSITHLTFSGNAQESEKLVRDLSCHHDGRWMLPKLWSLKLTWKAPEDQMELLEMVRARLREARLTNRWGRGVGWRGADNEGQLQLADLEDQTGSGCGAERFDAYSKGLTKGARGICRVVFRRASSGFGGDVLTGRIST